MDHRNRRREQFAPGIAEPSQLILVWPSSCMDDLLALRDMDGKLPRPAGGAILGSWLPHIVIDPPRRQEPPFWILLIPDRRCMIWQSVV